MAFHPYPRVIPPVFNPGGFGPPRGLTPASACPRIAHPASRPRRATERPVQTRFRSGSLRGLASPRTATRWLILQKARRHSRDGCSDCSGARGFRCCFTPLSGCFSPFPRGTGSLSVAGECSALEGGPPGFDPDSTWPGLLGKEGMRSASLRLRGSHPVPPAFPGRSAALRFVTSPGVWGPRTSPPATPTRQRPQAVTVASVWASPAFARRYSRDLG